MSREKELTKNTIIIIIGKVSTQFISFILLPLYTSYLSNVEYGTVDLFNTGIQLLLPIVTLMIEQGVFRYLLTSKDKNKSVQYISSSFGMITISNIVYTILFFLIQYRIENDYKFLVLLNMLVSTYSGLFLQIARGLKRINIYTIASFVSCSVQIVFNVIFIVWFHMGATGMLLATFIGNFVCCLYLLWILHIQEYIRINQMKKETLVKLLKYSTPLVPNQLSLWIMNSSDRIIISLFLGLSSNGILAISHKFPALFTALYSMFQLSWHETGTVHFKDVDRDQFFSDTLLKLYNIFSGICILIIAFLPFVFPILINESYSQAYDTIPIYMVASLFNVVVGILGVVYVASERTGEIAKTTILAAFINIVVQLVLIKTIGLFAAAISTFIGYGITMIYRIIDVRNYISIKYDFKTIIVSAIMIAVSCLSYYSNNLGICIIGALLTAIYVTWSNKTILKACLYLVKKYISRILRRS